MTHKIYMEDYGHKLDTAIDNLKEGAKFSFNGKFPLTEEKFNTIDWATGVENGLAITTKVNPHSEITWTAVDEEIQRLEAEYEGNKYQRNRKSEYPTIEELVVALYDTDDKSAVDTKRAEVKAKYPKS